MSWSPRGRSRGRPQEFYNDPSSDNLSRVRGQIDDVKSVMVQNIEKILDRGEKIELLVDKTDQLSQEAFKFEKSVRVPPGRLTRAAARGLPLRE